MADIKHAWPCLFVFTLLGLSYGTLTNRLHTLIQKKSTSLKGTRAFASAITICHIAAPLGMGLGGLAAELLGNKFNLLFCTYGIALILLASFSFYQKVGEPH